MNQTLLKNKADFCTSVLKRDKHECVFCHITHKTANINVHFILASKLWSDGGTYLNNGASVCDYHLELCRTTELSPTEVREAAGINKVIVPPELHAEHEYDTWGNPLLEDGRRGLGELFFDEEVQLALKQGPYLDSFTAYVKYPRTNHLPWSPGLTDDDRVLPSLESFLGREVVITTKMDGECTTMYKDRIHARSIDSRGGEDRAWVKQLWSSMAYDIPAGWRICGENLWAEHSIHYDALSSYFLGFSIWNEQNICLSWDETQVYFELLGVTAVTVLYRGKLPSTLKEAEDEIRKIENELDHKHDEGYVVRLASQFSYRDFKTSVAKFVRKGHVTTAKHWRSSAFIPNKLAT